ncbi:hypothetical protein EVAR_71980_1, partial [Eumeta japonica]
MWEFDRVVSLPSASHFGGDVTSEENFAARLAGQLAFLPLMQAI